ncbi:MAG TPA: DUF5320 domain-containing protein [Thermoanaerobacterales bacterium]|jgi:hypothetical protein|nr:DUF5320 domain-containing protein [Thermoanaerobacterales bacterium]
MPAFDGTGPMGQGTMTGRGMGYCVVPMVDNYNPYPTAYPSNYVPVPQMYSYGAFAGFGRGCSRGGGRGRGFACRNWF